MAAASVCAPRVSSSCLLPPQEPLPDQQMGLTQDFFKWLLLGWVLECVEFCVCSLCPTALVLLKVSPTGLQTQVFWELIFLVQLRSPVWGSDLLLPGENLCNCNYPLFCGSPT